MFAQSSTLNITGSMFGYNSASYGGVMVTSESTVNIDNSSFIGNTANNDGAVFFSYNDSFSVAGGCTFLNNHASLLGGVIHIRSSGEFYISNSNFTNNSAHLG